MARVNPWSQPRIETKRFERTFTDPDQAEPLRLVFERPDPLTLASWIEQSSQWAKDYAQGVPLPEIPPRVIPLSETQWGIIGTLMACEVPDEDGQTYDEMGWIGVSQRYPKAWMDIVKLLPEITGLELPRDDEGNSPQPPPKP